MTWFKRISKDHPVSLEDLMTNVDQAMGNFAPIMNLPVPEKSLSDFIKHPVS